VCSMADPYGAAYGSRADAPLQSAYPIADQQSGYRHGSPQGKATGLSPRRAPSFEDARTYTRSRSRGAGGYFRQPVRVSVSPHRRFDELRDPRAPAANGYGPRYSSRERPMRTLPHDDRFAGPGDPYLPPHANPHRGPPRRPEDGHPIPRYDGYPGRPPHDHDPRYPTPGDPRYPPAPYPRDDRYPPPQRMHHSYGPLARGADPRRFSPGREPPYDPYRPPYPGAPPLDYYQGVPPPYSHPGHPRPGSEPIPHYPPVPHHYPPPHALPMAHPPAHHYTGHPMPAPVPMYPYSPPVGGYAPGPAPPPPPPPPQQANCKYTCRYRIGIENDDDFGVMKKLIGPKGQNMKTIAMRTGAKLRVRGRGSGFLEHGGAGSKREADEPLMLCISCPHPQGFADSKARVEQLLRQVQHEYIQYCKDKNLEVPDLRVACFDERTLKYDAKSRSQPIPALPPTARGPPTSEFEQMVERNIEARNEARRAHDFKEADRIRDFLKEQNVVLMDEPHARGPGQLVTSWRLWKGDTKTGDSKPDQASAERTP